MSKIQVLVATMHQKDHSLLERMNIQSDAIVGNQCDYNSIEHFKFNENEITYLNFDERGIGLNRNNALMRANADICLFADDDMIYYDGYADKVQQAFDDNPKADVIIFNVKKAQDNKPLQDSVTKNRFVGRKGVSSYGTVLVGIRLEKVRKKNIVFHTMFGGGAEYSCGEDTIFLQDCIKNGLKIYTSTVTIGVVYYGKSTWFKGYTDKYFFDKGVLFKHLYPRFAKILAIYHVLKHRNLYAKVGIKKAVTLICEGTKVEF